MVALGLSRSLVTGDGPNFATASVSMQKMMVMIREIKQAARKLLDWVFDDWMELNGHGDKSIQFIFNDLDPSDAVDFKKLLIELYDRKLISRSSLQLKMDLDPDIEAANRETESLKRVRKNALPLSFWKFISVPVFMMILPRWLASTVRSPLLP